ncbi:MAG: right-handed parallel beta-helix repeat-containing protein [Ignavibacteriales bacterium]|nr:right-handed parallel beta-helix repeat-containing protein [Ignavibacteriales bacterium]
MKFQTFSLIILLRFAATFSVYSQTTVFVSPIGLDTDPGTIDQPLKTIKTALSKVGTNGTVYLRGGLYVMGSSKLSLTQKGDSIAKIKVWAYQNEKPVLDCSTNTSDGISISGSNYYLRGIDVMKAGHNGINISGNNNIVENSVVHDNGNTGLHITGGTGAPPPGPSNNFILNCDAYLNYDPPIGGNADGFSAKWTLGQGNVFRGCRSWNNSDDGWDLWMGTSTVVIDSCYAFRNGWDSWHSGSFDGNGNGFKIGGNYVAAPHRVTNCVAFDNAGNGGRGFDENNNTGGQTLYNCTAFRNRGDNYHFANTVVAGQQHVIKNCVSLTGTVGITSGTLEANSWQGFSVTGADFFSIDTAVLSAPRDAKGTFNPGNFLHLASGSTLIDAGVNVGIPYLGKAPDLGAFEFQKPAAVNRSETFPQDFNLLRNYPNPFNPTTRLSVRPSASGHATLFVYTMLGGLLSILFDGTVQQGEEYSFSFDASRCAGGSYLAVWRDNQRMSTTKMLLVK